jgi:hypothetical protein
MRAFGERALPKPRGASPFPKIPFSNDRLDLSNWHHWLNAQIPGESKENQL